MQIYALCKKLLLKYNNMCLKYLSSKYSDHEILLAMCV